MSEMLNETVLHIRIANIEDPGDFRTWENVRLDHIAKADKVIIQYRDRHGLELLELVKDRFGTGL